jgi:hypothetical protein
MYIDKRCLLSGNKKMSELRFKRRFSPSVGTKASVITVPRAIAQAWEQYEAVDLIFDGDCLIIRPTGDNE